MPAGRPTKYSEKMVEKTWTYLELAIKDTSTFPSIEDLALYLEVNPDTVHEWKKKHKEYSEPIKRILAIQKSRLMTGGLTQEFNPTMSIFLLKANHGMIETEKRILAGDKNNPLIPTPILGGEQVKDVSTNDSNKQNTSSD